MFGPSFAHGIVLNSTKVLYWQMALLVGGSICFRYFSSGKTFGLRGFGRVWAKGLGWRVQGRLGLWGCNSFDGSVASHQNTVIPVMGTPSP